MIITCPNCKKKFNIDTALIPADGRELQCGSCSEVWFYKLNDDNSATLTLNDDVRNDEDKTNIINKEINEIVISNKIIASNKTDKKKEMIIEDKEKELLKKTNKKDENMGSKFFSYLIVFIISSIILVILLDTLKTPLISIFPGLEIVLFNLFETLKDIKLFIIDLY